jgi:hypothetical protein
MVNPANEEDTADRADYTAAVRELPAFLLTTTLGVGVREGSLLIEPDSR